MSISSPIERLQSTLGYQFRDARLLELALTHRSLARDGAGVSNQRLEFLGDAVLGLAIADMLYALYPTEDEGDLSKRLVSLVNGVLLSEIAATWNLGEALLLSGGEREQGGRQNPSNLEDACEAVLGAIYRDGGFEAAQAVIARFWQPYAEASATPPKDAKTALQEWAQARGLPLPEYMVLRAEGPSHAPQFVIELRVRGLEPVQAQAGVKKQAERLAAEAMLAKISAQL
jgi:ribonuclease-3